MIGLGLSLWPNTAASALAVAGPTWNPSDKSASVTLSNGNLTANSSADFNNVRATTGNSSGKWYFETLDGASPTNEGVGVADASASLTTYLGNSANGIGYYSSGFVNGFGGSALATRAAGDVVGVAFDAGTGKIWWAKNNVWLNGDPVAGTQGAVNPTLPAGTYYPAYGGGTGSVTARFASASQTYAPPTGFTSWAP